MIAMNQTTDWLDAFCCLAFGLVSLGGWMWLYWGMSYPVQPFL